MRKTKSHLLILAKYINQEILIEELFRVKGLKEDNILSKYHKKTRIIKIKIIFTKIFYSIIFGILPVIPLFTYFDIQNQFINDGLNLNIIVFGGSLLYSFFFIMQLLNVIFMGMIEISLILSKNLFFWLETLPISAKELKRLKLIAIFHNFDIPIIVITLAFPIVILIATLNIVIFFISLGISILQIILSFNILIFVGNRINKSLDIRQISSRKTLIIRLVNIFGFLIIFFGTLIFIQWAISSIVNFFMIPIIQQYPTLINLILCSIPYPFSLSYLISFISTTTQIHYHFLIGLICGLGLFIIFDWWVSKKALKVLDKTISSKQAAFIKYEIKEIYSKDIKVKVRKPIAAYIIRDFKIITRNLKAFLSLITPILISFVFTYTLNLTILGTQTLFTTDIFYNWSVILAFQPVICGMIIYNLINIEGSGESILQSLPTRPKEQAKSKLIYFLMIQTIAIISPYLIYLFHPEFMSLFISLLISLPFSWIILISMFELYVYFFGKKKYRYVLEPVTFKNKFTIWTLIYVVEYCFYIFTVTIGMILNYKRELFYLTNFIIDILICYTIVYIFFNSLFAPNLRKKKKKIKLGKIKKSKYFIEHPWLSISIIFISNFLLVLFINLYILALKNLIPGVFYPIIFWMCLFPTLFLIFLRIKFIPSDPYNKSQKSYRILISIISGIIGAVLVIIIYLFFDYTFSIPYSPYFLEFITINFDLDLYAILTILIFAIWHEILFRGILLPISLSKYKKNIALFLNLLLFIFYYSSFQIYLFLSYGNSLFPYILFDLNYMLWINVLLLLFYLWQNQIYPGLIIHTLANLFGVIPLFYFGIFTLFPNFI